MRPSRAWNQTHNMLLDPLANIANTIICGDALGVLNGFPADAVPLIVTSPPYNLRKNYDGYDDDLPWPEYHTWLMRIARAMYRVACPNGNIFINIVDAGISNREASKRISERGNFHVIPTHVHIIQAMIGAGAQYLHPIFWRKPSSCSSQFGAAGRFCGTYPFPPNCHVPAEIEYILHFRKKGPSRTKSKPRNIKEESRVSKERWLEISGQIWEFNGVIGRKDHPASFPLELPLRCIEGWSLVRDVVLDPFIGAGTTALAAQMKNRRWVGIDQSPAYCQSARDALEKARSQAA